ncbi:hypothetical protein SUGI_0884150 [Cryptomeria japonica]|nr:hypothetical protein SUGI_0884150 [Cryptomeria japonica]
MTRNNLQVLKALDVARTQWYHFTAIVIAGMGFFTDAYDLFVITTPVVGQHRGNGYDLFVITTLMKMPETARYTALVEGNAKQAPADMSSVLQVDIHDEQEC